MNSIKKLIAIIWVFFYLIASVQIVSAQEDSELNDDAEDYVFAPQVFDKGTDFQLSIDLERTELMEYNMVFRSRYDGLVHQYSSDKPPSRDVRKIKTEFDYDLYVSTWWLGVHGERVVVHDLYLDKVLLDLTSAWPVDVEETDNYLLLTTFDYDFEKELHLIDKTSGKTSKAQVVDSYSIKSEFGVLFICDINSPNTEFETFSKHCKGDRKSDDEVSINLNGKKVWEDQGLLVSFEQKFSHTDDQGNLTEIFVFHTSTGGTACPLELTAIVISDKGVKAHGPFGNCMDREGVRIEQTETGIQFMFECGLNPMCKNYSREYAYHCFVSNDLSQDVSCDGMEYCSAYGYPEDLTKVPIFTWDAGSKNVMPIKDCQLESEGD